MEALEIMGFLKRFLVFKFLLLSFSVSLLVMAALLHMTPHAAWVAEPSGTIYTPLQQKPWAMSWM